MPLDSEPASAVGDEGAAWAINLAVAERQIRKRPRRGTPAAPVQVPLPWPAGSRRAMGSPATSSRWRDTSTTIGTTGIPAW